MQRNNLNWRSVVVIVQLQCLRMLHDFQISPPLLLIRISSEDYHNKNNKSEMKVFMY